MTDQLTLYRVNVSERTTWLFLQLSGADGCSGVGEATLHDCAPQVIAALPIALAACDECTLGLNAKLAAVRRNLAGPVGRALSSALQQAWLDRYGRRANSPLHVLLGGRQRDAVPCYANINRGTTSRQPAQFADRAEAATGAGYGMVKLAPFDGLPPPSSDRQVAASERRQLCESALRRVAAVSERLAGGAAIAVDCHSRLSVEEARDAIDRLAPLGVSWLEEPIAEHADKLADIVELRALANARGLLLSGAENMSCPNAMATITRAGCYDVVMPDIVLAGGPLRALQMAQLAAIDDARVSLHNPSGPVMDVFSAQLAATLPELHSLERQYDESPLYGEIIDSAHEFRAGHYRLADAAGAGCRLNTAHPQVEPVTTSRVALP